MIEEKKRYYWHAAAALFPFMFMVRPAPFFSSESVAQFAYFYFLFYAIEAWFQKRAELQYEEKEYENICGV